MRTRLVLAPLALTLAVGVMVPDLAQARSGCDGVTVLDTCNGNRTTGQEQPPPSSGGSSGGGGSQPSGGSTSQPSSQPSGGSPSNGSSQGSPSGSSGASRNTQPALVGGAPARLLELVNAERARAGLPPLTLRRDVSDISGGHSLDMAGRRTIWHNDSYFTAGTKARLSAKRLGENVARNGDLEDAHRRLMASPPHRANILNGAFDAVGIAVASDGTSLYVTENFVESDSKAQVKKGGKKGKSAKAKRVRRTGTRRARR